MSVWKDVPGYAGRYEVSDAGEVRSNLPWRGHVGPRLLSPHEHTDGYLRVMMRGADGSRKGWFVHRLVLLAFEGECPEGMETRHLDGDPRNNELSNLRYGTHSENMYDKVEHGTDHNSTKTHCINGHPFTPENTGVRTRSSAGARWCRTCCREQMRRSRERRRGAQTVQRVGAGA